MAESLQLAYRYRLYPTKAQETALAGTLETCRQVYNSLLNWRKHDYEVQGTTSCIRPPDAWSTASASSRSRNSTSGAWSGTTASPSLFLTLPGRCSAPSCRRRLKVLVVWSLRSIPHTRLRGVAGAGTSKKVFVGANASVLGLWFGLRPSHQCCRQHQSRCGTTQPRRLSGVEAPHVSAGELSLSEVPV